MDKWHPRVLHQVSTILEASTVKSGTQGLTGGQVNPPQQGRLCKQYCVQCSPDVLTDQKKKLAWILHLIHCGKAAHIFYSI